MREKTKRNDILPHLLAATSFQQEMLQSGKGVRSRDITRLHFGLTRVVSCEGHYLAAIGKTIGVHEVAGNIPLRRWVNAGTHNNRHT